LHQALKALQVSEVLLYPTTAIVLPINHIPPQGNPGGGFIGRVGISTRQELTVHFLMPLPLAIGVLDPGINLSLFYIRCPSGSKLRTILPRGVGILLSIQRSLELFRQEAPMDALLSNDLSNVTVTISADDIPI
jgi:hypothetical protein